MIGSVMDTELFTLDVQLLRNSRIIKRYNIFSFRSIMEYKRCLSRITAQNNCSVSIFFYLPIDAIVIREGPRC